MPAPMPAPMPAQRVRAACILFGTIVPLLSGCHSATDPNNPWNITPNCKANDAPLSQGNGTVNPYDNGYRMTRETDIMNYYYNPEEHAFNGDEIQAPGNPTSFPRSLDQQMDDRGLLVSGGQGTLAFWLSSWSSFDMLYNSQGQITSYIPEFGGTTNFIYSGGRLQSIKEVDSDGSESLEATFQYDDSSHRVSATVFHSSFRNIYYYRCNDQNQITVAYFERRHDDDPDWIQRLGRYELEYDENGNVVALLSFADDGSLIRSTGYEYVPNDRPTFNHWQMRLAIGLIANNATYVH